MKIKTKKISLEALDRLEKPQHKRPLKPLWILGALINLISLPELWAVRFKVKRERMEEALGPCLILMNHSCFLDMKIAYRIFFPKRFSIVCTTDALVGKSFLMRILGCIPTNKFVTDITLIGDIIHSLKKNKTSVLMYPEAGYSFDGKATALPPRLGVLVKKLGVPVVTVITEGAFLRDPLYNGLRKRDVTVNATVKCLLTPEEIKDKPSKEITDILTKEFSFDGFLTQQKNEIPITETFRAEGLERILYRCPACLKENEMKTEGSEIFCEACQKRWELDIYGNLRALSGKTEFSHIPDWYAWERDCIKESIKSGSYKLETDVEVGVICDNKALYMIGDGHLTHTSEGFFLKGINSSLDFHQSPTASYSLNSDYFWYEIGDVICIGDRSRLYYCFPKENISVTKARLAAEEIYKLNKAKNNNPE